MPSRWEQVEIEGKNKRQSVENRNAIPSYAIKHNRPFSGNVGGLGSLQEAKARTAKIYRLFDSSQKESETVAEP